MQPTERDEKAKKIIADIIYVNIATVTGDGRPWNTPVYAAYNERYEFFWASWQDNQHSQNIREGSSVFLTIYNSTAPEGTGEGVYIQAKAFELTDPEEIMKALPYYYGRKNKQPREAKEFLAPYPRRMYKALPEHFWINDNAQIEGNDVDTRVEVTLP